MQKQQDLLGNRGNIDNILNQNVADDALKQILAELKRTGQEYVFQQQLFRNEVLEQVQMEIEKTEILQAQISLKLKSLKDFLRANNFQYQSSQLFEQMRDFRSRNYIEQQIHEEGTVTGGQLNQSYAGELNQLQELSVVNILPNSPEVFQQQGRFQPDQICGINLQQQRNCSSEEKQNKIDQITLAREENTQLFKIDQQKILQQQPSSLLGLSSNYHSQIPNSLNHLISFSHEVNPSRMSSQNMDMNQVESRNFQKSNENIQFLQTSKETHLEGRKTELSFNQQLSLHTQLFNPSCSSPQTSEKLYQIADKITEKLTKIYPKIEEPIDQSSFPQQVSCFEEQLQNSFERQLCQKKLHVEEGQQLFKNGGSQKMSLAAMAPQLLPAHPNNAVSPQSILSSSIPLSLSVVQASEQIFSFQMSKSFLKDINAIMPPLKRLCSSEAPANKMQISQQNEKIPEVGSSNAGYLSENQINKENRNEPIKDETNSQTNEKNLNQTTNEKKSLKKRSTDQINSGDYSNGSNSKGETNQTKNLLKGFRRRMLKSYNDSTVKMDNFQKYFDSFTLGNELILHLLDNQTQYYEDFQIFLKEDPMWWIQEAKIQDVNKQIDFMNRVQSKKYSKLKTKCKNKNKSLEAQQQEKEEYHSNNSFIIRSSIALTDQNDEKDKYQQQNQYYQSG